MVRRNKTELAITLLKGISAAGLLALVSIAFVEASHAATAFRPQVSLSRPVQTLEHRDNQECSGHNGLLHHVRDLGSERIVCPTPAGQNPPGRPPQSLEEQACRIGGIIGCEDEKSGALVVIGSAFVITVPGARSRAIHIATASHNLIQNGRPRRGCVFEPYGRGFLRVPIEEAYFEPPARNGREIGTGDRAIARLGTNPFIQNRRLDYLQYTGSIRLQPTIEGDDAFITGASLKGGQATAQVPGRSVVLSGFHPEMGFVVSRNCHAYPFDPNRDSVNRRDVMVHSCSTSPLGMGSGGPVLSSNAGGGGRLECIHSSTYRGRNITNESAGIFRRENIDDNSNANLCRPITSSFVRAAIDFMGGTQQASRR